MISIIVILFAAFCVISFVHYMGKNKKPCKRAFVSMLLGVVVLFAVNILSSFTNVVVPVCPLSLCVCAIGGIPGVALLVIIQMII